MLTYIRICCSRQDVLCLFFCSPGQVIMQTMVDGTQHQATMENWCCVVYGFLVIFFTNPLRLLALDQEPGGKKVIDKNFPAVRIRDRTGRFSKIPTEGILVTSPAALEYLYYMEHRCPVNAQLGKCLDDQKVTRSSVDLAAVVRCKHCESLHEDIGDFFGENPHKKLGEQGRRQSESFMNRLGDPCHDLFPPWKWQNPPRSMDDMCGYAEYNSIFYRHVLCRT